MPPRLTIVVPVHNEAGFLPEALPRLIGVASGLGDDVEVLVAENGSTDSTAEIARSFADAHGRITILNLPEPDYGAAMRAGFLAARGEWVANVDIDYFSEDFLSSALGLADEADVVLASKRAVGAEDRRSLLRRLGTFGFNLLLRALFRSKVSDTHGMKVLRRSVVTEIAPEVISTRDLFDTELVIRAERAGYRIVEVPALVEEMREARSSFLKRVPRTLAGLLRIRRALRGERRSAR